MRRASIPAAFALLAATATGCTSKSKLYCEKHPDDAEYCAQATDADSSSCRSSAQCAAPTPACNTTSMTCVECTASEASACEGATPVCGDDERCRTCVRHDECASAACLPSGACADEAAVAYVAADGTDNATCTKAEPCTKVSKALATNRPTLLLDGAVDEGNTISIDNRNVTVLATQGAKLVRTSNGIVLEVKGSSQVAIYDLEISGGSGAQGIGISMPTGNTAKLTLSRTRISENNAGGISINGGEFDITNSFIVRNGSATSTFGGLRIDNVVGAGTRRLDFNTIAGNVGASTVNTGVSCGTVLTLLTFSSNIIYGNLASGGGAQIGGSSMCTTTYSDVGPGAVTGNGNINQDPDFVAVASGNFHLRPTSPARDAADPSATLGFDFDGDARPQGTRRDIGADEVP